MNDIQQVSVLGCGLMGRGIAQTCATAGFRTTVRDISDDVNSAAREAISKSLDKLAAKGRITSQLAGEALNRIDFTTDIEQLAPTDFVIEAVTEDLDLKNSLWRQLTSICADHTIFASNTSSLTIAAMAKASGRPDRFVGLHFFNPVPLMKLVEVVRTITTSENTLETTFNFARSLGKEPVAAKDDSGFIVNRLLVPYLLDAIRALEAGVGSVTDIDKGMVLGTGHPMGPFTLLDFVGLDTTLKIAEIMFDEYREKRYAPPPLLRRMVLAEMFGRKNGIGFYDYSNDPPTPNELGV
ncbi:MAG: 3-hydroxyacyl-CoA dehydrogenase family protein [Gemmatimonadales bacterium]